MLSNLSTNLNVMVEAAKISSMTHISQGLECVRMSPHFSSIVNSDIVSVIWTNAVVNQASQCTLFANPIVFITYNNSKIESSIPFGDHV